MRIMWNWKILQFSSQYWKVLETRLFFYKNRFYSQLLWNFKSWNKKSTRRSAERWVTNIYLVTYVFFVKKVKRRYREFTFLTSLICLSFLHAVTSMIRNVISMTVFCHQTKKVHITKENIYHFVIVVSLFT